MSSRVTINRYSRFEEIGKGSFSRVFKAWSEDHHRWEAIKVLRLGSRQEIDRATFAVECRAMGSLSSHPQVVTMYGSGFTNEGHPYISMELYKSSLADRIKSAPNGCLPVADVLDLGVKIFGALNVAHREGILHRDIKPQNILYSPYGPVLTDFGIASLPGDEQSQPSWALSRHYAAPEVLTVEPYTESCDIYSLGATLYSALEGRQPFWKQNHNDKELVEQRICTEPPPPITAQQVPPAVEDAIRRLLAKHARDRPTTAREAARLLADLQRRQGLHPTNLPFEDDHEHDETEIRDQSTGKNATPVEDPTISDPTIAEGAGAYRETASFRAPTKSRRPLLAAGALAGVLGIGAMAVAISTAGGTGNGGPTGPTPTATLPTSAPEMEVDVIPRAPGIPVGSRGADSVTFEWDSVENAAQYRIDVKTGSVETTITDEARITFDELQDEGVICVVVHAVSESQQVSRGSEQACV